MFGDNEEKPINSDPTPPSSGDSKGGGMLSKTTNDISSIGIFSNSSWKKEMLSSLSKRSTSVLKLLK